MRQLEVDSRSMSVDRKALDKCFESYCGVHNRIINLSQQVYADSEKQDKEAEMRKRLENLCRELRNQDKISIQLMELSEKLQNSSSK